MFYSLIIAALILAIAVFFGKRQNERLGDLESRLLGLREKAVEYGLPTDLKTEYAPTRLSHRTDGGGSVEEVRDFSGRLVAFVEEMKERQRSGDVDVVELQQRGMNLLGELVEFSPGEIKILVNEVLEDEAIEEESKGELLTMSVMILSQEEPETALSLILEIMKKSPVNAKSQRRSMANAIGQLTRSDPQAAVDWLQANKEEIGGITDRLRDSFLSNCGKNMKVALAAIPDLGFKNSSEVFSHLGRQVTEDNFADFVEGVRAESADGVSRAAFESLASSPFTQDFEVATEAIKSGKLTPGEARDLVKGLNFSTLNEATGKWLGWMGENEHLAPDGGADLIEDWARADFQAAGEWVNSLEAGNARNRAVLAYAQTLAEHEAAAAATWADALPAGSQQNKLREDIYRQWKKEDPRAAAAYAEKHGLAQ